MITIARDYNIVFSFHQVVLRCHHPHPGYSRFRGALTFLQLLLRGRHIWNQFFVFRLSPHPLHVLPHTVEIYLITPTITFPSNQLFISPISLLTLPFYLTALLHAATESLRRSVPVNQEFAFQSGGVVTILFGWQLVKLSVILIYIETTTRIYSFPPPLPFPSNHDFSRASAFPISVMPPQKNLIVALNSSHCTLSSSSSPSSSSFQKYGRREARRWGY